MRAMRSISSCSLTALATGRSSRPCTGSHSNFCRKIGERLEPLPDCYDADRRGECDDDRQRPTDVDEEMINDAVEALISIASADIACIVTEPRNDRRARQNQDCRKAPRQAELQRMPIYHCLTSL